MKIARLPREAAAIVMLRRKNYSINSLSRILGRSTSFISRILKANGLTGCSYYGSGFILGRSWNKADLRKVTGPIRKLNTFNNTWAVKNMEKIISAWLDFINGEADRPP